MNDADPNPAEADDIEQAWLRRCRAVSRLDAAPEPDTGDYVWLLRALAEEAGGAMSPARAAAFHRISPRIRAIAALPWERRYIEIAVRDARGLPLGGQWRTQWLSRQRRARRVLARGRVQLLDQLTGFVWDPADAQWNATYAAVKKYADDHGRIPTRADDLRLSNWLACQRFALRRERLRADRAAALAALPGWRESLCSTRSRQPWERRCDQVRGFIARHGRYPDAGGSSPAERALAQWVTAQREQLRRDGLAPYRREALSTLPGWRWNAREQAWDRRFAQLCAAAGDRAGVAPGHPLYTWVVAQRRRHRNGRLSPEQTRKLRAFGLLRSRLPAAA